jgi:hypothetical protein
VVLAADYSECVICAACIAPLMGAYPVHIVHSVRIACILRLVAGGSCSLQ